MKKLDVSKMELAVGGYANANYVNCGNNPGLGAVMATFWFLLGSGIDGSIDRACGPGFR